MPSDTVHKSYGFASSVESSVSTMKVCNKFSVVVSWTLLWFLLLFSRSIVFAMSFATILFVCSIPCAVFYVSRGELLYAGSTYSTASDIHTFHATAFDTSSSESAPIPYTSTLSFEVLVEVRPSPMRVSEVCKFFATFVRSETSSADISMSYLNADAFLSAWGSYPVGGT